MATAPTTSTPDTGDQSIDGLLGGTHWNTETLTFSFPDTASQYGSNYSPTNEPAHGFESFNTTQRAAIRRILTDIESFADIDFVETTGGNGVLKFGVTDTDRVSSEDGATSGWGYRPDYGGEAAGDTWFDPSDADGIYYTPNYGNRAYIVMAHEIGHALGFRHPDGSGGVPSSQDNHNYTIMSHNRVSGGNTQTYQQLDIAALQHMYGANFNSNSGDTVYTWSPTTAQKFINGVGQGAPTENQLLQTLWDGGGVDTYDFSNYTSALTVDLNPGDWTSLGNSQHMTGALGEIANAQLYHGDTRSLIENAKGGSGNDSLTGNQAANVLEGGGGIDRLKGNAGNDTFLFRTAADTNNGSSFDTILDFTSGDKIDVSNIDADSTVSGLQDFTFAGSTSTLTKGRLGFYYDSANNRTLVEGNTDTDATSELKLALSGNHLASLSAADFVL